MRGIPAWDTYMRIIDVISHVEVTNDGENDELLSSDDDASAQLYIAHTHAAMTDLIEPNLVVQKK
jgi:hypothetical protein